ncbi:hypothetical protein L1987_23266 [Smallanthus sonchifolius]|uniref:Uncharacterized protein n=1 Tax=Smallanthus sonchifolius TaxID=185202 RepID=A0ACB9IIM2_9ASTR|nr:hypothetical protein L1987_23266 [Smallanthus sonchifolius]
MDLFGPISIRSIGVRRIRSDNGSEFKNGNIGFFCLQKGIHHEFSAPYVPQQNGVAERKNRTLIEAARTMLADSKLPVTFWAEAVNTACHVLNRVLIVKRHNKTCYELLNGRNPNLNYLLPFGNPCTLLKIRDVSTKFSEKTIEGIFMGESTTLDSEIPVDQSSQSDIPQVDILPVPEVASIKELKDHPVTNIIGNLQDGVQTRSLTENTCLYSYIRDTGVLDVCLHSCFISQVEPKNVEMALQDNNWIEAMQEELAQFDKLKVWNLVDLPKGLYPIGTKWVYKCKKDDSGVVVRNTARLVIQGFNQQEGIDYTEVYAPIARLEAIHLFLAFASFKGFKVYQLDVKSAFLYGKVKEEVYVYQPSGFEDPLYPTKVFKLDKALYGLRQAPRAWY